MKFIKEKWKVLHVILADYCIAKKDPFITLCPSSAWEWEEGRNGVCVLMFYEQMNMNVFPFAFTEKGQLESRLGMQE